MTLSINFLDEPQPPRYTLADHSSISNSWVSAMAVVLRRFWPFLLAIMVVSGLLSFFTVRFGSVNAARAYLAGHVVIADPAVASLGTIAAEQVVTATFPISNLTGNEVSIVGCKSSCNCVATTQLPLTLPPHARRELEFKVVAPTSSVINGFEQQVELILNVESQPVVLTVSAKVE